MSRKIFAAVGSATCLLSLNFLFVACHADLSRMNGLTSEAQSKSDAATATMREERTFALNENGEIEISNTNGNIKVGSYDADKVLVVISRKGKDASRIEIEEQKSNNRLALKTKSNDCRNCDYQIDYEISLPKNLRLKDVKLESASGNITANDVRSDIDAKTASGNVRVTSVTGRVEAKSASGNVQVAEISGTATAQTASGNVRANFAKIEGDGDLTFESASGNVEVKIPSDANAQVELSTMSGNLKTSFPLEVRESQFGVGAKAEGQIGSGGRKIEAKTMSGNVNLSQN